MKPTDAMLRRALRTPLPAAPAGLREQLLVVAPSAPRRRVRWVLALAVVVGLAVTQTRRPTAVLAAVTEAWETFLPARSTTELWMNGEIVERGEVLRAGRAERETTDYLNGLTNINLRTEVMGDLVSWSSSDRRNWILSWLAGAERTVRWGRITAPGLGDQPARRLGRLPWYDPTVQPASVKRREIRRDDRTLTRIDVSYRTAARTDALRLDWRFYFDRQVTALEQVELRISGPNGEWLRRITTAPAESPVEPTLFALPTEPAVVCWHEGERIDPVWDRWTEDRRQTIRDLLARFDRAWLAGDVVGFTACFDLDAAAAMQREDVAGRPGLRHWWIETAARAKDRYETWSSRIDYVYGAARPPALAAAWHDLREVSPERSHGLVVLAEVTARLAGEAEPRHVRTRYFLQDRGQGWRIAAWRPPLE